MVFPQIINIFRTDFFKPWIDIINLYETDSLMGGQLFPHKNRISLGPHWIQRAQSTMREEWTQHRNICLKKKKKELSGLNFLREIKETSKKCKSETLNPVSTQGSLYHFTSNHANDLKWWFCSVPWEFLKSRDPLGKGVQETKSLFTTTLNITSMFNYVLSAHGRSPETGYVISEL